MKPKEEKGKLEDEADKLLAMREKLKKEKEEAEKKRLAEENVAAEAKGRVLSSKSATPPKGEHNGPEFPAEVN